MSRMRSVVIESGARRRVDAAVKYVLPYSLDYNPIEQMFAKLKAMLRKTRAKTCVY